MRLGIILACLLSLCVMLSALCFWWNLPDDLPQWIVVDMCMDSCGLGNQMFRYAAGLSFVSKNFSNVCVYGMNDLKHLAHPSSAFALDVDVVGYTQLSSCPEDIQLPWLRFFSTSIDNSLRLFDVFDPPHSKFKPFSLGSRPVVVVGYLQSFKYFQTLQHPFFRMKMHQAASMWLAERGLTSVVHVRRGDKLEDNGDSKVPISYYRRAMMITGSRIAVCTDDPEWVRAQPLFQNATISIGHDPGFDMALIAAATEDVIIGIGTFGWWGAYLSEARRKFFYHIQYRGTYASGYEEADYIPYGVAGQWISLTE